MERPQFKPLRRAYGFDEVSIVPGDVTINPEQADTALAIGGHTLKIPIVAAALDALVSPETAGLMSDLGGLGVLNLDGVSRVDGHDLQSAGAAQIPAGHAQASREARRPWGQVAPPRALDRPGGRKGFDDRLAQLREGPFVAGGGRRWRTESDGSAVLRRS